MHDLRYTKKDVKNQGCSARKMRVHAKIRSMFRPLRAPCDAYARIGGVVAHLDEMRPYFCQVRCANFHRESVVEDRHFRRAQGSSPACCSSLPLTAQISNATKRKLMFFATMLTEVNEEAWRVTVAWLICAFGEEAGLQSCLDYRMR